ncbi:MAG: inorganic diphosphatase, partial [Acidobacteria bacterium]|nr:inorganic diphosphatase [Acidobacteriota bacterium]
VLVLMDEPAFAGCLVRVRLLGVIEAEQTERDGQTTRNDRLIGVAAKARQHGDVRSLKDLGEILVEEVEHFFVSYNEANGKVFKPLGRFGPIKAGKIVDEGIKLYRAGTGKSRSRKRGASARPGARK